MGGRGGSSVRGGGAGGSGNASPESMTDAQLNSEINRLQSEIDRRVKLMDRLESEARPTMDNPDGDDAKMMQWRENLYENQDAQNRIRDLRIEQNRRRPVDTYRKPFVNSIGEATHREITNGTYKRLQRRMDRETQRRMSGYR